MSRLPKCCAVGSSLSSRDLPSIQTCFKTLLWDMYQSCFKVVSQGCVDPPPAPAGPAEGLPICAIWSIHVFRWEDPVKSCSSSSPIKQHSYNCKALCLRLCTPCRLGLITAVWQTSSPAVKSVISGLERPFRMSCTGCPYTDTLRAWWGRWEP